MSKYQNLQNQLKNMHAHINSISKNYKDMPYAEKVIFAQQAFNNINNYCSLKWNMNPNDTPFGYSVGINYGACAFQTLNAVTLNLGSAIGASNPEDIYKTLFHEMGHIHQFKTNSLSHRLTLLNRHSLRARDGSQTSMQHKASPNEVAANHFAYTQLIKMNKAMLKNPDTRVQAAQSIKELRVAQIKNIYNHVKGIAQLVTPTPILKLFGVNPQEKIIGNTASRRPRILNLQEVREFFTKNPESFKDPAQNKQDCSTLREFIISKGDDAHLIENFFGVNRSYNSEMNARALHEYNSKQEFEESPEELSEQTSVQQTPLEQAPAAKSPSENCQQILQGILATKTLSADKQPAIIQELQNSVNNLNSSTLQSTEEPTETTEASPALAVAETPVVDAAATMSLEP